MNIGVDIDNTIFDTNFVFFKYLEHFIKEENVDYFEWYSSNSLRSKFYKLYLGIINDKAPLINGVRENISLLRKNGNRIYFITNRSEKYVKNCYSEIKKVLEKNHIEYDGIYMVNDDKSEICKRLKINCMIDDNINICEKLNKKNIIAIIFDKDNRYNTTSLKTSSWYEIPIILSKIKQT